jgi:hypothetical protein
LEQVARGSNRLAKGRNVDQMQYRTQGNRELGHHVAAGSVLLSALKFSLDIELRHLDIAKGHVDVFVAEQLHKHGQADAQPYHFGRKAVTQAMRSDFAGAISPAGVGVQHLEQLSVKGTAAGAAGKQKPLRLG